MSAPPVSAAPHVAVGQPLPDLILPRLDGGDLRFDGLRGHRTLLFFWGSW